MSTLVEAAISGDARAQALVLGALMRFAESDGQDAAVVSPDDEEILEAYAAPEERAAARSAHLTKRQYRRGWSRP